MDSLSRLKSLLSFTSSILSSLPFTPFTPFTPFKSESESKRGESESESLLFTCPSSPLPPLISSVKSESESESERGESELVFGLKEDLLGDYLGLGFWYGDCPAVVSSSLGEKEKEKEKSFTLPSFLFSQCGDNNGDFSEGKTGKFVRVLLPSECFGLRSETDSWRDFIPNSYSYRVLFAILGFGSEGDLNLKNWVLVNSPKFGVVIDGKMRDCVCLLLRLCLKAVLKEACGSLEVFLGKDGVFERKFVGFTFQCPNLVKSFCWLSNQLAILYGEINGRIFALNMIKEAIVKSGYCNMMNNFGGKNEARENNKEIGEMGKVFVSQIAGAIGALHQRAFLEGKKRSVQPVSKHHLLMECAYLSSRAAEERSKRANYRPILDHDSLLSSRVHDQGNNGRAKTKEEILAEERDYKRRRISYRGKKVKRSPTEVLRDIIQEHMEEIQHANTEPPFQNPNKPQYQNPNSSKSHESSPIHEKESIYQKSEHKRSEYSHSHHSSSSCKEYKDQFGVRKRDRAEIDRHKAKEMDRAKERDRAEIDKDRAKERDRAKTDRHRAKERKRDNNNNDRYKRKEARRDYESYRSESVTFNDRYDPTWTDE